jgi:PAS domain S-box-containing protein
MSDRVPSPPQVTEGHYRQIVQSAVTYAIVSCDLRGVITTWNEGAQRVLGWTAAEICGQSLKRFFTPEDVAQGVVEAEMRRAESDGCANDERWHLRKNGTRFWASGELLPLKDETTGTLAGFVKILRDRTEWRRRDAQLRELNETLQASEGRLQMALDVGGMAVWQCDLKTQAVQWWPGMQAILGLPADTPPLRMDEYYALVHPGDRERVLAAMREVIAKKSGSYIECRIVWQDGSVHWLDVRCKSLMDLHG